MDVRAGPIMIYTEALEELVPFYRGVLGLPVKSYEPGHSLWLATAPELVLHAPEEPWYPAPYTPAQGGVLVFLAVEDLDTTARRLEAEGVPILARRAGLLLVRDPEGRRLGLTGSGPKAE